MNSRAIVHPTLDALESLYLSNTGPRTRLASAIPRLDGTHFAMAAFAAAIRAAGRGHHGGFGLNVRFAAQLDGATIAEAQQF